MIILIPEDKDYQTYEPELEIDEESAVIGMSVSFAGTGDISERTTVTDMMDIDVLSSNVVGLIGSPYEIETSSNFDEATITFTIDQSKLGDTEFANLGVLWYDEENEQYIIVDSVIDDENSNISATVNHFSKYLVVDQKAWLELWTSDLNYPEKTKANNTVLAIDCSGSMAWNDPMTWKEYAVVIDGISSKDYKYFSHRIDAGEGFVNSMREGDKAAIVAFESTYKTLCSMTDKKDKLIDSLQNIYSNGGTDLRYAISGSLLEFNDDEADKYIILMSDGEGDSETPMGVLTLAMANGVRIYTIGIGSTSGDAELQRISELTGGKFYKSFSASDLEYLNMQIDVINGMSLQDTDGDGIPDIFETNGMLTQNGTRIYTDPNNPDTDGDGLLDGEEIDGTPIFAGLNDIKIKEYQAKLKENGYAPCAAGIYFKMKSDPNVADSDGDGISNDDDIYPNIKNEIGKTYGWNKVKYNENTNQINISFKSVNQSQGQLYGIRERCYRNIEIENSKKFGYITNQSEVPLEYGNKYMMEKNGCELIAIYNALKLKDKYQMLSEIAMESEISNGMVFNSEILSTHPIAATTKKISPVVGLDFNSGLFGTNPFAIDWYLNAHNYRHEKTTSLSELETWIKPGRVFIFSYWNDKSRISEALHTIALKVNNDGTLETYNNYKSTSSKSEDNFEKIMQYKDKEGNLIDGKFIIAYCIY